MPCLSDPGPGKLTYMTIREEVEKQAPERDSQPQDEPGPDEPAEPSNPSDPAEHPPAPDRSPTPEKADPNEPRSVSRLSRPPAPQPVGDVGVRVRITRIPGDRATPALPGRELAARV
jgi:hypothetical protein